MIETTTLHGTLEGGQIVTLDAPVDLPDGRIEVVIRSEAAEPRPADDGYVFGRALERIWERQKARGHIPPTREEVDEYLRIERDSWDD